MRVALKTSLATGLMGSHDQSGPLSTCESNVCCCSNSGTNAYALLSDVSSRGSHHSWAYDFTIIDPEGK